MKCSRLIIAICLLAGITAFTSAADLDKNGTPHPHGITPDGLGTAVTFQDSTYDIIGGTQAGSNLFHSFGRFSVHSGETAVFHDAGTENTIGRVTGGEYSWINGTLESSAGNLYLLNPAGVMFGSNATLDLQGSFHVSTANYLRLGENERFYAEPLTGENLSVSAPAAFGFLDDAPGKISAEESFLQVPMGKTLSLTGGDIHLHDTTLFASGGRIHLASGASAGEVRFSENGLEMSGFEREGEIAVTRDSDFRLFDEETFFADIEVSGMETGHDGGSVSIRGGRFELAGGSVGADTQSTNNGRGIDIRATNNVVIDGGGIPHGGGIQSGTTGSGNAGNITIKSEQITVRNEGFIVSSTSRTEQDAGKGGNIELEASDIAFTGGAGIHSNTDGTGKGGTISLKADDSVFFTGEGNYNPSIIALTTGYERENAGEGGGLEIEASDISFSDGASIDSSTYGTGKGGRISLKAENSVSFAGGEGTYGPSIISLQTSYEGEGGGEAGSLEVNASNIVFSDGTSIDSTTYGTGKGGAITLKADNSISFNGESSYGKAYISVATIYPGEGGGEGGNLKIEASDIVFSGGASMNSATFGTGKGGMINLKADNSVLFEGRGRKHSGQIYLETKYQGEGGSIEIEASDISFTDGAIISSATSGTGRGGTITLKADNSVSFAGENSDGSSRILLGTSYEGEGAGEGGHLEIEASDIAFSGGAWISSATYGTGKGGTINLKADNSVSFAGEGSKNSSQISLATLYEGEDGGEGGHLEIEASDIAFSGGAWISSATYGTGKGGTINLKADNSVSFAGDGSKNSILIYLGSEFKGESGGEGGSLEISASDISLSDGAWISSKTSGTGKGGTINLKADNSVSFVGDGSEYSTRIYLGTSYEGEGAGEGGHLEIEASDIAFSGGAWISSATYGTGKGGTISLKADNSVSFAGEGSYGSSRIYLKTSYEGEDAGDGGSLEIEASDIAFSDGALIDSSTSGPGKGGTISLKADNAVSFSGENSSNSSLISLETSYEGEGGGEGGSLEVEASDIAFSHGAAINSTTFGTGKGGTISLKADNSVSFAGEGSYGSTHISLGTEYEEEGGGEGGSLEIEASDIAFSDGAYISSRSSGTGKGGDINLKADSFVSFAGEGSKNSTQIYLGSEYEEESGGEGGSLVLNADRVLLADGAWLVGTTFGSGDAGDITLLAEKEIRLTGQASGGRSSSILAGAYEESTGGDGGKVLLSAENIFLDDGATVTTSTGASGNAGDIGVEADHLELRDNAAISSGSESDQACAGSTGKIIIAKTIETEVSEDGSVSFVEPLEPASSVTLRGNSAITTDGANAGGGKIMIDASESLILHDSEISTSVLEGGDGGDIRIGNPEAGTGPESVILNHSTVRANAEGGEGYGGAVFIVAENYLKSSDSSVTASSKTRGHEGTVEIDAPDTDLTGSLAALSGDFPDASRWMKTPCALRTGEDVSRFVIRCRDGVPVPPEGVLASPPYLLLSDTRDTVLQEAKAHCENGEFAQAAQLLEQSITERSADANFLLDALPYLSQAYQGIGHFQKALTSLRKALPVGEKTGDHAREALLLSSLSDISLSVGEKSGAMKHSEDAENAAVLADDPRVLASALNNRGNVLAISAYVQEEVMATYSEALEMAKRAPDASEKLQAHILSNMARVSALRGQSNEVMPALDRAMIQVRSLPEGFGKASVLLSLGMLCMNTAEKRTDISVPQLSAHAAHLLTEAGQLASTLENPYIGAYALGCLGKLCEKQNRHADALRLTRQAIFLAQQGHFPESLYLWQWQAGRLLSKSGDTERAVSAYQDAIRTLTPIRGELFTEEHRTGRKPFDRKIRPLYLGLAELFLAQAEASEDDESREKHLRAARDTMERLKTAELQDFFEDECVTDLERKVTKLDQVPEHTAILYPIPLADALVLLLTLPDGMRHVRVPANSEDLESAARGFRRYLQKRASHRYRKNAEQLYDWLIRPVQGLLEARKVTTLVIAPDSVLRLIPFAALHDGREFLVEKYALVTIPAVTLTDPRPFEHVHTELLASGLSEARHGFPALPGVPRELADIEKVMGGRKLLNEQYTTGNLKGAFGGHAYSVVHMATHGMFGSTAKDTFLLTYDGKLTMNRLEELIHIGQFRETPVELLTLSACQTAIGDERAALGLAGVAVRAGARSAVATLWSVHDEATVMAVTEFYRQLKTPGVSKAEALQHAQKSMVAGSQYRHPVYWASFLLIGNWL